eukprot:362659-Chlamydomonas_euryale.AAC.1
MCACQLRTGQRRLSCTSPLKSGRRRLSCCPLVMLRARPARAHLAIHSCSPRHALMLTPPCTHARDTPTCRH